MGKKGKPMAMFVVIGIVAIIGLLAYGMFGGGEQSVINIGGGASDDGGDAVCGDDKASSFAVNLYNSENTTGAETFDATGYLYLISGGEEEYVQSITDTTNPTALTTLICGERYALKLISADGSGGDNARIISATGGNADIIGDGEGVEFSMGKSTTLTLRGSQHATIEARVYDNEAKGYVYDSGDASASNFETTGAVFTSTTDNATATDESAGIDMTMEVRSTASDTNFNDLGMYILLDNFESNVWDTPAIFVDGVQLADYTDQLNSDEKKAYTGYEYVYRVPASKKVLDAPGEIEVRLHAVLLDGASATTDLEIEFAPIGQYLSTDDGVSVIAGSVKDDSTQTAVFTIQAYDIDIT